MPDNTQPPTAETQRHYLTMLADELTRRGFKAQIQASRSGVPLLHVTNPAATVLSETIDCSPRPDGPLWFHWPWRKPIAPADQTQTAADEAARVLESSG